MRVKKCTRAKTGLQLPVELAKALSRPLLSGVAGREREACTAVSIFTLSCVGELGADILLTSDCLSRTASSCRRSTTRKQKHGEHFVALLRTKTKKKKTLLIRGKADILNTFNQRGGERQQLHVNVLECEWQRGSLVKTQSIITSGFIL